jgi:chemotaxis protein CheX
MSTISDEDIQGIVENVWLSTLGLGVEPTPPLVEPPSDAVMARVDIDGAWDGTVLVRCALPLAREVAAIMFHTEPEGENGATPLQVSDAIAEIVNMIGGNLKALLPQPCALALPVAGVDAAPSDGRPVVTVAFECLGRPFVVEVHTRDGVHAIAGA